MGTVYLCLSYLVSLFHVHTRIMHIHVHVGPFQSGQVSGRSRESISI